MTTRTHGADKTPFYVAFGERFSHVRGRDAADRRLAEYMGVSLDDLRQTPPRQRAGLIKRIAATAAHAAGLE